MQKEHLEKLKQWFAGYVKTFYVPGDVFLNNNLHLKECHTRRVCTEMRALAKALTMDENESLIAETVALLHDIGRFEQFRKYRTYKDAVSENHCLLGLRIIAEKNLIAPLPQNEQSIIRDAVEFHGVKALPVLDDRTSHITRMIRDVDKLDIFRLCLDNYRLYHENQKAFTFEMEFPDSPEVSPEILDSILNNRLINYRLLCTLTDMKLLQLGWVFDTCFDWTLRQMHDRGYIDGIIRWLPPTEPAQKAATHIKAYVADRLVRRNPPIRQ